MVASSALGAVAKCSRYMLLLLLQNDVMAVLAVVIILVVVVEVVVGEQAPCLITDRQGTKDGNDDNPFYISGNDITNIKMTTTITTGVL